MSEYSGRRHERERGGKTTFVKWLVYGSSPKFRLAQLTWWNCRSFSRQSGVNHSPGWVTIITSLVSGMYKRDSNWQMYIYEKLARPVKSAPVVCVESGTAVVVQTRRGTRVSVQSTRGVRRRSCALLARLKYPSKP